MSDLELYEQKILLKQAYDCPEFYEEFFTYAKDLIDKISDAENNTLFEFSKLNLKAPKVIKAVKQVLSKLIKRYSKVKKSKVQKIIDILAEIFKMEDIEKEIFSIYLRNKLFCAELFNDNYQANRLIKKQIHKSPAVIKRAKRQLERKGIDIEYDFPAHLDNLFFHKFDSINLKNVSEYLLGQKCSANFKIKDFKHLKEEHSICVNIIENAIKNNTKGINILLYGVPGSGKTEFAKLLAKSAHKKLYEIPFLDECNQNMSIYERVVALNTNLNIVAEHKNALLLSDEADDITDYNIDDGNKKISKILVNNVVENTPRPIIWTLNNVHFIDDAFLRRMTYAVKFTKLDENTQVKIWQKELKRQNIKVAKNKIIELSSKYDVSISTIKNAVDTTKLINGNANDFESFIDSISTAMNFGYPVKNKNQSKFNDNGFIYNDQLTNTDINLKNLTERLQQTRKLNFSICMYGEPGTGKSEYARYLAHRLGLPIVQKRASDIFDKFVGQTEENIAAAFKEAKAKKAMLIIDEADSFLQSRNNAKQNWEISFVNEMLTQMENFEYPFVCTTNLMDTLDEASLRRFTFKIKFDFLTDKQISIAFQHFFKQKIRENDCNIAGLSIGDFATVKKKIEFLGVKDKNEILNLLTKEVKFKKSDSLKNTVGF